MDSFETRLSSIKESSLEELISLCDEIRHFLIASCSETGGHIGANLGVVELSVALHRVFNSPIDSIIFDTGHIGYTHKLLTGRKSLFSSLNTFGGMNRFITPDESEHDLIEMSHAGTSLSIGLGLALAKQYQNDHSHTISVIGDGSLAEGIALEALNHISTTAANHLLIINDNGYAISPGCGAIHEHLSQISAEHGSTENFFTSMGYDYSGPLDGHNLASVISALSDYKEQNGQKVLHFKTEKGKGYKPADSSPIKMHFSNPYCKETGSPRSNSKTRPIASYATDGILKCMGDDASLIALTAGTKYATDLDRVASEFPSRTIDPGMTEQHLVSLGVGMTLKGLYPILNYQSTFLQRAYDQLMHDAAYTNNPMMILASRSGFAGYDNPTHHGIYDLSYLKALPNFRIIYPANCFRLREIVEQELIRKEGPVIICYPYGNEPEYDFDPSYEPKSATKTLITTGNLAAEYQKYRIEHRITDVRIEVVEDICPEPNLLLHEILNQAREVFVIEEAVSRGGIGDMIASYITRNKLECAFYNRALENKFYPGGTSNELRSLAKIDARSVFTKMLQKDKLN